MTPTEIRTALETAISHLETYLYATTELQWASRKKVVADLREVLTALPGETAPAEASRCGCNVPGWHPAPPAAPDTAVWKPKCYIHSTRGWNGKTFGQECALHGPFTSKRQRHGEYDIPCPFAEKQS